MKVIFFILFILLIFNIISCKEKPTEPPVEEFPSGYQHDIPWHSLADSPWPKYRADAQSTGRAKFTVQIHGELFKKVSAKNSQDVPVIGNNNIMYFNTSLPGFTNAIMNYSDSIWAVNINSDIHTSPLIDSENNVYVLGNLNLTKYKSSGEIIWLLAINNSTLSNSLVMDLDGNLYYVGNDYTINCIDKNGNKKWIINENRLLRNSSHSPAFSPDGKILYLQGETVSLIALDINSQSIKWEFGNKRLASSPVVDYEGNIYIIPSKQGETKLILYSITKNNEIRWEKVVSSKSGLTVFEPTITKEGNILFGVDDSLFCLNYSGEIQWSKNFPQFSVQDITVDNSGNIFLTLWSFNSNKIISLNKNGDLIWEIEDHEGKILYPPILNNDNSLIITQFRGDYIYIIK